MQIEIFIDCLWMLRLHNYKNKSMLKAVFIWKLYW